jgi:hypothetical protein
VLDGGNLRHDAATWAMMLKNVVSPVSYLPVAGLKFPPNQEAPLSRYTVLVEPSVSVTPIGEIVPVTCSLPLAAVLKCMTVRTVPPRTV